METKTLTTPEKGPAAVLRSGTLFGLLRKMMNRHFTMAADEYREGASDSSVRKHGEEFDAAEAEFLKALAEVIEDKERLDWLIRRITVENGTLLIEPIPYPDNTLNARPAIDAAMREPNSGSETRRN